MTFFDEHQSVPERKANTLVVFVLLIVAAGVFSWLGAYAVTNVLVANDLMRPWPADQDPRPMHMVLSFAALLTLFVVGGGCAKLLSARQLRRIDCMADE